MISLTHYLLVFSLFVLGGCAGKFISFGEKDTPPEDSIQLQLMKEVLPNGLTVILVENRKLPLFSFYTFVKVGSRHEPSGMTGASHYLEHLMFKGSKNYAAGEFEKIIIGNGGSHNAYTTRDLTVYHESLPTSALDKILDLEADRLFNLSLEENSFKAEKKIILEERKYRTENSPSGELFLQTLGAAYKGTPYAHPPIGSVADIVGVTQEQIKNHFETYYDPHNVVVIISGDFENAKLMKKIRKKFGRAPSRGKLQKAQEVANSSERYSFRHNWKRPKNIQVYGHSPLPLFMVAYPSFPKGDERSFALNILSNILGGGKSSYFPQKYVHGAKPILGSFGTFNYGMAKGGLLLFSGQLLKGKKMASFRKTLTQDLRAPCEKVITDREVEKVKNSYLVNYFGSFESNSGLAELVGEREVTFGDPFYFKQELKKYLAVTSDEVREICTAVIEKNSPLIVSIWNKHKKK